MDSIDLLVADHNRVRGLFKRFKAAHEKDDTAMMTELAGTIFNELNVHTTIEEEIFYPWARGVSTDVGELVDEGMQEHHVAKTLMSECGVIEAGNDEWTAKVTVLIEAVEHHAEEEEKEMFPKLRSASSSDDRAALMSRMEARKRELGAPILEDKIDLTTTALRQLASKQEIPGRSKMDHDELAATVSPS